MSQKGEKYARRMERRVDKLEQDVAAITTEQTTQGVRISAVEDDLAVYRAAVSARELKQAAAEVKAAKERRTARAAERERKARRRNKVLAFIALALFVAVCVVMVAKAYSEEPAAEPAAPEASAAPAAILPTELLFTAAAEEEYMEDPQETEKIEEALLAQGYFSLAVPMPYEWQDYMRTYCEEYGCPYPLALAVAQTESNFDMDAVGASGEVGIMQLNPGPGRSPVRCWAIWRGSWARPGAGPKRRARRAGGSHSACGRSGCGAIRSAATRARAFRSGRCSMCCCATVWAPARARRPTRRRPFPCSAR